jgi:hypothetical protein
VLNWFARRVARVWAGHVFAALVPVSEGVPPGAETFLEDLWRTAPWRVALSCTLAVVVIALSPPLLLGRPALFHTLSPADRERLLARWARADAYLLRMLLTGVKGQALVAVLRDPACRRELGWDVE